MIEQKKKSACVGLPNNAFRNEMATLLYAQVISKSFEFVLFCEVVRFTGVSQPAGSNVERRGVQFFWKEVT